MELDSRRQERPRYLPVKIQRRADQVAGQLLYRRRRLDLPQMLRDDAVVDGVQGVRSWETQGEHGKVTLYRERLEMLNYD